MKQIICEECEGKGLVEIDEWQDWQYNTVIACCPACHGEGRVDEPEQEPEQDGDE